MAKLVKADGSTVTQASYTGSQTPVDLGNDYVVPYDIYELTSFPGVPASSGRRRKALKYSAGQRISQKQLDDLFAEPTVTSVSPNTGALAGGTVVTIRGTNLLDATGVTIGVAATEVTPVSETELKATTAATTAGAKNVVVTTPAGNVTLNNGFTYA